MDGLVQCEACEHGRAGIKRADVLFERCVRCNEDWPENGFQGNALQAWRANKQPHLITCAGCVVSQSKEYANTFRDCIRCKQSLPLGAALLDLSKRAWSPTVLRNFLDHDGSHALKMTCYDCQYPECTTPHCHKRPKFAVTSVTNRVSDYLCDYCHWPPCSTDGCVQPRPRDAHRRVSTLPEWFCAQCRAKTATRLCPTCNTDKLLNEFDRYAPNNTFHKECRDCAKTKQCTQCGKEKPPEEMSYHNICVRCQSKMKYACNTCGREKPKTKFVLGERGKPHANCIACESKRVCRGCNKMKLADAFENSMRSIVQFAKRSGALLAQAVVTWPIMVSPIRRRSMAIGT